MSLHDSIHPVFRSLPARGRFVTDATTYSNHSAAALTTAAAASPACPWAAGVRGVVGGGGESPPAAARTVIGDIHKTIEKGDGHM